MKKKDRAERFQENGDFVTIKKAKKEEDGKEEKEVRQG